MHGCSGADATVATFKLLHNESVADLVEATTTIFGGDIRPKGTYFGKSFDEVFRKFSLLTGIFYDGRNFAFDPLARTVSYEFVFVCEQFVN